jgi:hypothetical protein
LLDFRLDPGRRRAMTESTLAEHSGGVSRPLIERSPPPRFSPSSTPAAPRRYWRTRSRAVAHR